MVRASDFGPRGPWFEPRPVHISLWPLASHIYGRPAWTDLDKAGDYVVPNVLSPRDLVFRPDNMANCTTHLTITTLIKQVSL